MTDKPRLPVYLDYAATTPVDPRVMAAMQSCLGIEGNFGNPASRSHLYGWKAEEAVELARRQVAQLVNADPREIIWTSGATEADNLALKGIAQYRRERGKHIISSLIEHKAVLDTAAYLERQGFEVTYLKPDAQGLIQPRQVAEALRPDTILVSLMQVNNEIGTLTDIAAIGGITRAAGVLLHVDAAQSAGKIAIDLAAMAVDLMSFSAHKVYGPKGVGALYVRRDPALRLEPQIHGGGHERGLRSGTLPTHQIVGMGKAFALAAEEMAAEQARIRVLRERLWQGAQRIGGVQRNGDAQQSVAGILNLGFEGVDGETLLLALSDIAVATGSACTSAMLEPSYVLKALGLPTTLAHGSIRFSLGRYTTEAEIDFTLTHLEQALRGLRRASR